MNVLDRIRDSFKYLDKNGLKHLIEKIKLHDVHWTGTHAEYEAQKDDIPAYAILHFTDDYEESNNIRPFPEKWPTNKEVQFDEHTFGYRYYKPAGSTGNAQGSTVFVPCDATKTHIIASGGSAQRNSDLSWHDLMYFTGDTNRLYLCNYPMTAAGGIGFWAGAADVIRGCDIWCVYIKD